jgi:hypothetical protein
VSAQRGVVFFVHADRSAMRDQDEQDPKKPHPVQGDKKKRGSIPIEAQDEDRDHHRHCC